MFEKETIRGYLKSLWSYAIMPIGKTIESAHMAQQNPHEVRTRGGFYAVLGGWLKPKVATSHSCPTIIAKVGEYGLKPIQANRKPKNSTKLINQP